MLESDRLHQNKFSRLFMKKFLIFPLKNIVLLIDGIIITFPISSQYYCTAKLEMPVSYGNENFLKALFFKNQRKCEELAYPTKTEGSESLKISLKYF